MDERLEYELKQRLVRFKKSLDYHLPLVLIKNEAVLLIHELLYLIQTREAPAPPQPPVPIDMLQAKA